MKEDEIRHDCAEKIRALKLYTIDIGNYFKKRDYQRASLSLVKVQQYISVIELDLSTLESEKIITEL